MPDSTVTDGLWNFQCRNAVWLPGAIMEASVATTPCNFCSPGPFSLLHMGRSAESCLSQTDSELHVGVVLKVKFKFRRAEIPAQYETVYTGK